MGEMCQRSQRPQNTHKVNFCLLSNVCIHLTRTSNRYCVVICIFGCCHGESNFPVALYAALGELYKLLRGTWFYRRASIKIIYALQSLKPLNRGRFEQYELNKCQETLPDACVVLRFFGWSHDDSSIFIVLEFAAKGELYKLLKTYRAFYDRLNSTTLPLISLCATSDV